MCAGTSADADQKPNLGMGNWGQITISTRLLEIARLTPEQQAALLAVAFKGDYWRPSCPSSGVKRLERAARKSGERFWGCENFPRCKTTQPMTRAAAMTPQANG